MGRPGQGLVSPGCPVCQRSVFPMEAVMAADRTPYHKVNNLTIGCVGDISLFAPYASAFFIKTLKVIASSITVLPQMQ